eukprot:14911204-Alexandrium_andersonii.AAC.1
MQVGESRAALASSTQAAAEASAQLAWRAGRSAGEGCCSCSPRRCSCCFGDHLRSTTTPSPAKSGATAWASFWAAPA